MKKFCLLILVSMILLLVFTSCDTINSILGIETVCEHEWADATCQAPKTCTECGESEGEKSDHNYSEATCTAPMTCKTCGVWYGLANGHDYSAATCTAPRTCKVCGNEHGDPVHDYTAATCTAPKTCRKCSGVDGEPLGHKLVTVLTTPTCAADGLEKVYCSVCDVTTNATIIPMINHADIPFEYNGDATATTDGTLTAACSHCDYSVTKTLVGSSELIAESFVGKKISILGDSISTYQNVTSGSIAAETTNSNVYGNIVWYGYKPTDATFGAPSVNSTWWQTVINALGATRLVNNSHSGESVFNAVKERCMQLHDDTGDNAGETPDIIFVYLGTNDNFREMGNVLSLSMSDIKAKGDDKDYVPKNLAEAYAVMLYRIQKTYPHAEIYCLTNLERSDIDIKYTHAVCQTIRNVVALFDGIHLVDIANESGITLDNPDYETYMPKDQGGKSIHPGIEGMKEIARVLLMTILENSRYMAGDFNELIQQNNN